MSVRLARGAIVLSLVGLPMFGMVGVAHAAVDCIAYPKDPSCLPATADKSEVPPGGEVKGTFGPVAANSSGDEFLQSTPVLLGTYHANAAGVVSYTVTIPKSTPAGQHHLVFPGTSPAGTDVTFIVPITVAGTAGNGSGLPLTGGQIGAASVLAVGLLGAGTLSVVASRRRKATVSV